MENPNSRSNVPRQDQIEDAGDNPEALQAESEADAANSDLIAPQPVQETVIGGGEEPSEAEEPSLTSSERQSKGETLEGERLRSVEADTQTQKERLSTFEQRVDSTSSDIVTTLNRMVKLSRSLASRLEILEKSNAGFLQDTSREMSRGLTRLDERLQTRTRGGLALLTVLLAVGISTAIFAHSRFNLRQSDMAGRIADVEQQFSMLLSDARGEQSAVARLVHLSDELGELAESIKQFRQDNHALMARVVVLETARQSIPGLPQHTTDLRQSLSGLTHDLEQLKHTIGEQQADDSRPREDGKPPSTQPSGHDNEEGAPRTSEQHDLEPLKHAIGEQLADDSLPREDGIPPSTQPNGHDNEESAPRTSEQLVQESGLGASLEENGEYSHHSAEIASPVQTQSIAQQEAEVVEGFEDEQRYGIQLAGFRDEQELTAFSTRYGLDETGVYFRTEHKGEPWYPLLFGVYAQVADARQALNALPADLSRLQPWIRPIPPDSPLFSPR